MKKEPVVINGRSYAWPEHPVVVVCLDGTNYAYLEGAAVSGTSPILASLMKYGTAEKAQSVIPSLTNPNNLSIVTGVPPCIHGIAGNYLWDEQLKEEVMLNDPSFLRAETILAAFAGAGAKVVAATAKDKLRKLLGAGIEGKGICFSAEKASESQKSQEGIENLSELVGMQQPSVYSAEISSFVLAAGARILETEGADLMYLSTTDYIQHKYAPGTYEANAFFALLDPWFGRILKTGATLVLTADHGMNPKTDADGNPLITYLQPPLEKILGKGNVRVVLPITDPYVIHHGSLGSYAIIHLSDMTLLPAAMTCLLSLPGVEEVLTHDQACQRFMLPEDRVGDLVVLADGTHVLGRDPLYHNLTMLKTPLRSHGGIHEQEIPLISNRSLPTDRLECIHNYDAFWLACNS